VDNLYCQCASVEAAPLQDETILFNPERKQFCVLNRTASLIWNQLATPTTTEDLAANVCKSFSGASMEVVLRDADRTVQEMLTLNYVARHSAEEDRNEPIG
jgi:Coenzyme PQQ synthesis protein D (PqqD)